MHFLLVKLHVKKLLILIINFCNPIFNHFDRKFKYTYVYIASAIFNTSSNKAAVRYRVILKVSQILREVIIRTTFTLTILSRI